MGKRMSRGQDRQVFRHTAVNSKRINVNPKIYRGGIRMLVSAKVFRISAAFFVGKVSALLRSLRLKMLTSVIAAPVMTI